jgi:hypothetical protein
VLSFYIRHKCFHRSSQEESITSEVEKKKGKFRILDKATTNHESLSLIEELRQHSNVVEEWPSSTAFLFLNEFTGRKNLKVKHKSKFLSKLRYAIDRTIVVGAQIVLVEEVDRKKTHELKEVLLRHFYILREI